MKRWKRSNQVHPSRDDHRPQSTVFMFDWNSTIMNLTKNFLGL